jgi:hypothetical protein
MDFEACAQNSPRGELTFANFPLTLPHSLSGKYDEYVILAVGLARTRGTSVTSLSWNSRNFSRSYAYVLGAELECLRSSVECRSRCLNCFLRGFYLCSKR